MNALKYQSHFIISLLSKSDRRLDREPRRNDLENKMYIEPGSIDINRLVLRVNILNGYVYLLM